MLVTRLVSQPLIFWLKERASKNKPLMLVTSDVSHPGMSVFPAAPQSAGAAVREQQYSPEGTAARHLSTAILRAAELGNGDAQTTVAQDSERESKRYKVAEGSIMDDEPGRPRPVAPDW
jgi:hypothetical protein